MNIDALKYVVLGSALTLAVVLLIYALDNSSSSNASVATITDNQHCETPDHGSQEDDKAVRLSETNTLSLEQQQETSPAPTNIEISAESTTTCDNECLSKLTQRLGQGDFLNDNEMSQVIDRAQEIALLISEQPEIIRNLEASLANNLDEEARNATIFLLSKLPREQILQSSRHLSASDKTADRIASLHLLESALGVDPSINSELNLLISTETNQDVLLNAIHIIHELQPEDIDTSTHNKLSNLIQSHSNDRLKKAALLAKTSVASSDEEVRQHIADVLQSPSIDLKLTGLQALDTVLERQKFKNYVNNIANDNDATPSLRIEALNLVGRHFLKQD